MEAHASRAETNVGDAFFQHPHFNGPGRNARSPRHYPLLHKRRGDGSFKSRSFRSRSGSWREYVALVCVSMLSHGH